MLEKCSLMWEGFIWSYFFVFLSFYEVLTFLSLEFMEGGCKS